MPTCPTSGLAFNATIELQPTWHCHARASWPTVLVPSVDCLSDRPFCRSAHDNPLSACVPASGPALLPTYMHAQGRGSSVLLPVRTYECGVLSPAGS